MNYETSLGVFSDFPKVQRVSIGSTKDHEFGHKQASGGNGDKPSFSAFGEHPKHEPKLDGFYGHILRSACMA